MPKDPQSQVAKGDPSDRFFFDEETADSAVRYVEQRCKFWQGEYAGEPFLLQQWQSERLIRPIFGWKRRDATLPRMDWPRRYRTCFLAVGKGNGKTPLGGAIGLLFLDWDDEPGAEVYSAAADRDQASIVFSDVENFIEQDDELASRLRVLPGRRRVIAPKTKSFYQVLTSAAQTKHGFRPHAIIFDELHTQPNRNLFSTLRRGLRKRVQSILISMTTAGEYDEDALWWSELEYSLAVQKYNDGDHEGGVRDDSHLPVVYKADEEDDPDLDATLLKANPNIGASVRLVDLQEEWAQAKNKGPLEQGEFKQLHLNIAGDSTKTPIDMYKWRKCGGDPIPTGPCYCGIDASSKLDLTAAALFFPDTNSLIVKSFMPEANIQGRKHADAFDYPRHIASGWIRTTQGNLIDQRAIFKQVVAWHKRYTILEVGYDPRFVTDLPIWLEEEGLEVVEVLQGFALSEAIIQLLGHVKDCNLLHGGNPVMRWSAQNLRVRKSEEGRYKAIKSAERKRIDPLTASLTAINRAAAHHEVESDMIIGEVAV